MKSLASSAGEAHAVKCELAAEVLRTSGILRLRVEGWSMLPTIWPGDMLVVQAADHSEVSDGDIVLFSRERRIFVHRIVATTDMTGNRRILTCGDAMLQSDPPLADRDLMGKVQYVVRNGKRIEPAKTLSFPERAVAGLVRRSEIAARIIVGVHGMRQTSEI